MQSLPSLVGCGGQRGGARAQSPSKLSPLTHMPHRPAGRRLPLHLETWKKRPESSTSTNQVTGRKRKFLRGGVVAGEHTAEDLLFREPSGLETGVVLPCPNTHTKASNHPTHYLLVPHSSFPPSEVWDVFNCSDKHKLDQL